MPSSKEPRASRQEVSNSRCIHSTVAVIQAELQRKLAEHALRELQVCAFGEHDVNPDAMDRIVLGVQRSQRHAGAAQGLGERILEQRSAVAGVGAWSEQSEAGAVGRATNKAHNAFRTRSGA